MNDEMSKGGVEHPYHNCKWGYVMCMCSKFGIRPDIRHDGSIATWVSLVFENEKLEITWFVKYEDQAKWIEFWESQRDQLEDE